MDLFIVFLSALNIFFLDISGGTQFSVWPIIILIP